jgi:SAM-dependent methyltransferase
METIDQCPICQGSDIRPTFTATDHTLSQEQFTVQRCGGCGFQFTSPRPTQERIGGYYRSENYISHVEKAHGLKDRIYHWVRRRAIRGKHRLIHRYMPTGHALDVGCGTGDFLAYLAVQGYAAQGVEISPEARAIAEKKGVPVRASLDELPVGQQFDLISLWHVLEHVPDPRATLEQLNRLCADGALLVVAVPDNASWDAKHYGPEWAAWDVPRHLSHFRQTDMHRLLREGGFDLVDTRRMWFDAPYVSMLSEQYKGRGPLAAFLLGALRGVWSNVVSRSTGRPTSSSLYLAKKSSRPQKA